MREVYYNRKTRKPTEEGLYFLCGKTRPSRTDFMIHHLMCKIADLTRASCFHKIKIARRTFKNARNCSEKLQQDVSKVRRLSATERCKEV